MIIKIKARFRAEVYATNEYLKGIESSRFREEEELEKRAGLEGPDRTGCDSDDSDSDSSDEDIESALSSKDSNVGQRRLGDEEMRVARVDLTGSDVGGGRANMVQKTKIKSKVKISHYGAV